MLLSTDIATTLRDVQIRVPVSVKRGDNVNLFCQFDLEGDSLYSVKWYKGKREFFRFTPNETPSLKVFPVAGIIVEVSKHFLSLFFSVFIFLSFFYECNTYLYYVASDYIISFTLYKWWYLKTAYISLQKEIKT